MKKEKLTAKQKNELKAEERKLDKAIGRRQLRKVSQLQAGTIVVFRYQDPKTKDQMELFDASPLVVVLDTYTKKGVSYMLGVNLHWVKPQKKRKEVFQIIIEKYLKLDWVNTKNLKMVKKRFIDMVYSDIKGSGQLSGAILNGENSALRLYIVKRAKDIRLLPLKHYNILFGPQGKNMARSRWSHLSKGHKIKGY